MGEVSRVVRAWVVSQCLNLHRRSDWMTEKVSTFLRSNGAHGSTMHCASVPIQSQWGSVNGRRQWARGVRLVQSACVCQWMTRVCLTYRVLVFVLQPIKSLPATKPMCGYRLCLNSGDAKNVVYEGVAFVDREGRIEGRTNVFKWDGLAYGAFPVCVTSR